jgi:chemotaxis protein histidine kinase CheA
MMLTGRWQVRVLDSAEQSNANVSAAVDRASVDNEDQSSVDKAPADKATSGKADETAADKTAADKTAADKTAADQTAADKTACAADKTATDKAAADKTAADKTAADKTAADKTAADKTAADKTAADKTAADKTAADKTAADKTACAADKAAADKTAADKTAADKAAPVEATADKALHEVECVLGYRTTKDDLEEYQVKWKGFGPEHASWEPAKNVEETAPESITAWKDAVDASRCPRPSSSTMLWCPSLPVDINIDDHVVRAPSVRLSSSGKFAEKSLAILPSIPMLGVVMCQRDTWYTVNLQRMAPIVALIEDHVVGFSAIGAAVLMQSNHDGSRTAVSIRFLTPWIHRHKVLGQAVLEFSFHSWEGTRGSIVLCRSLCGRHDCVGTLASVETPVEASRVLAEMCAILSTRVRSGLPVDPSDVVARLRNSVADSGRESSETMQQPLAVDFLGNKVSRNALGSGFLCGGDVLVLTNSSKQEHARLLAFVQPGDHGPQFAVVRWWMQASTIPKRHKHLLRVRPSHSTQWPAHTTTVNMHGHTALPTQCILRHGYCHATHSPHATLPASHPALRT